MKKTLPNYAAMSNRKFALNFCLKSLGWITNSTTNSERNSSFQIYSPDYAALMEVKERKSFHLIYALTLLLLFVTSFVSAQDVLVGLTSNGGPNGKGTAFSIKTNNTAFNVIKGFADWGTNPVSDLVRGSDGNLYGMITNGGTYGHGTIFRMTPAGAITILKNFNLTIDGGYPKGSLIQAKDGNFYGTTSSGSYNNGGCIFKITPSGSYSIIRSLSVNTDGGRPKGHLIQATDGNFYGVNNAGGTYGYGNIFKITASGQYSVLKSFNKTNGASSDGSLVQGSDGAFYGMTHSGGTYDYGVIFRITSAAGYSVLRHLNAADGVYPSGDLIQAKDGYLYGMAPSGGNYNGTIFKINISGASFKVLRALNPSLEGGNAQGSLVQAADGSFYGMTYSVSGGYTGSVFKMTTSGTVTAIKKFTYATEGGYPFGSLIQITDGSLYGMTSQGGKNDDGTIFKITTSGTMTVLSHLNGATQGNTPQDNLAVGNDNAFYGVATYGGATNSGTIFKICGGVTTVLRSLSRNIDGGNPTGGVVKASDGNFYGMTEAGGSLGGGTIYRITPAGSFTVLRNLKAATDGAAPKGTLIQGKDGLLYGMTYTGGSAGGGTIFKISTSGSFTVLRNLSPSTDGYVSQAGLVQANDGNFYGLTGNTSHFFKITSSGSFSIIRTFVYNTDGTNPAGNLILGSDGAFYGTMSEGGTYQGGVIFKITTSGTLTKLRQLNPATDGSRPQGGLVQASDGYLYGTTSKGGTNKVGTIFKITTAGSFTVLRHFSMAKDGGEPLSGLIKAPKNSLVANAQSLTTAEDVAKAIILTGSGGSPLTYTIVIPPKNGTVTSGTSANRTYTPNKNFAGKDSFAIVANIGCMSSSQAWVKITVSAVNDAPVLGSIGNKTVVKGSALKFTAAATDPDAGQTKTFSVISAPSGASINSTSGAFAWTPSTSGTFIFKVRVTDNGSPVLYDEEQITVTVTTPIAARSVNQAATKISSGSSEYAKVSMFPNPVTNNFTVRYKGLNDEVTVRIIDMSGSVVQSKKLGASGKQQLEMDASYLKPGHYIIQLITKQGSETLKFIKL